MFKIDIGRTKLTARKWKGKDKKVFKALMKSAELHETELLQTLVYGCIEEDVILSVDEFKYVLSRIRAESFGEEYVVDFYCAECGDFHTQTFKLKDTVKYSFSKLDTIKVKDIRIKLGEIKNKEIYLKLIAEDDIYDLLLRVEMFNGDNTFTLESLVEKFDDLDIDILTQIIETFENSKFKVADENMITCPHCKAETLYKFDRLPNFLPDDWLE